jgi:hypothetical protein
MRENTTVRYTDHRAFVPFIVVIVVVKIKIKIIVKRRQETGRSWQRGRPAPAASTQLYATSRHQADRHDLLTPVR